MSARNPVTVGCSPMFVHALVGRAPPAIRLHVHPCASCGAATGSTWFCVDCQDRARQHRDDDAYDDLGGESGAA